MNTYLTRSPISHDGNFYEVGTNIDLTEERAVPLLACGAIEATPMTVTEAEAGTEVAPGKKAKK